MEPKRKTRKPFDSQQVISWLITIIGIIAAIYAVKKGVEFATIAMITAEALLAFGWAYIIYYRKRDKEIIEEKDSQIKNLKDTINNANLELIKQKDELEEERKHIYEQFLDISSAVKSNNIHSNDILVKVSSALEEQYEMLSQFKELYEAAGKNDTVKDIAIERLEDSADKYAVKLMDAFNRYCRDATSECVKLQTAYLKIKGYNLKPSVCVKLMDRPYHPEAGGMEGITVYTAFRDYNTYCNSDREIGVAAYTISGNSAFTACMTSDHFRNCNAKPNDDSYQNQREGFEKDYNCVMTVPIRLKRANGEVKYFGYLCCDCLNNEYSGKEVFDVSAAQYLYAFAQNMATFLETLDSNWIDRFKDNPKEPDTILEVLFKRIFKNEK